MGKDKPSNQLNIYFPDSNQLEEAKKGLEEVAKATFRSPSATARLLILQGIAEFRKEKETAKANG